MQGYEEFIEEQQESQWMKQEEDARREHEFIEQIGSENAKLKEENKVLREALQFCHNIIEKVKESEQVKGWVDEYMVVSWERTFSMSISLAQEALKQTEDK